MEITGIDFVCYTVKDLDGAIDFYQNKLGLKLDYQIEGMYAEFDVGGQAFGLYSGEEPKQHTGIVAFHVKDVQAAVEALKSRGVDFEGDVEETPVCRMAFCKDPEGNSFMLHEIPKV